MAVTIIATPGAANANSFITEAEATAYFDARLPLPTPWEDADDPTAALAMAARLLNAIAQPRRRLVGEYYITSRQWTGVPATVTQVLAWPRIGMYDINGNLIAPTVIPQALKDAQAELAGQLVITDTSLDNEASVSGISSVKAGSVAVTFKDMIQSHVIPDAVWLLMPESWFTAEIYEPAVSAMFDMLS